MSRNYNNYNNRENNREKSLRVTPVEDLIKYSRGSLVELPQFAEGQKFIARIKRPSMMVLAKSGKIPNELMSTANSLFADGGRTVDKTSDKMMDDMYKVMEAICEASFVEPTYKELKDNGVELTDEQMMFIFNYSQEGVAALKNFRKESGDN